MSTSKHTHTPDVVLDTLEQLKGVSGGGGGGGASEPSSPLHSRLLREGEGGTPHHGHPLQRSASSASDVPSSFRPAKTTQQQLRSPLPSASALSSSVPSFRELRPPATRPKPVVFPKGGGGGSPATGSPTSAVPPTPPPPLTSTQTHPLPNAPPPPPQPPQSSDKSCPA